MGGSNVALGCLRKKSWGCRRREGRILARRPTGTVGGATVTCSLHGSAAWSSIIDASDKHYHGQRGVRLRLEKLQPEK